jgi:hypothetical protein
MTRGHSATNITTKKILDACFGGQLYSKIFMNFAEVVIVARELED